MAKSARRNSTNSSNPNKIAKHRDTDQPLANPQQTAEVEADHQPDSIETGSKTRQGMNLSPDDIIFVNTDDQTVPQAGDSLFATRRNRMIATLGKQAELVSVLVQAYNQLEKVKMCVECILKFTPVIEYELILFDNGSTDGTLDYFKSVKHPRKKIIRVTKNVGSISNHVYNHYSGRYLAYIMGDVYVTQNWLKNLLACIKSDQAIGMVVPVASNVSLQGANITFDTLDEMQAKAANHNISNPKLWHERLTLFPAVGLYKREALELGGVGDSGFFHYLADNDMSFRIRRAGFKLVLCEDTFVHHDHIYANVSEKDNERNGRSMEAGRKDFKSKYFGVEAWDDVNNFEPLMMSLVSPQEHLGSQGLEILGVDVFCGTPILEVKNKLREALVYAARLSAFSTDPKYWLDLKTICTGDVVVDRIEHIKEHFADEQFDYIVMGIPINSYQNPLELLHYLLKHVKSDGHLLLKLRNTSDVLSLFKTLGANINVKTNNVYQLSMDELIAQMKSAGFVPKKIASENWPLDEKNLQFLRNAITATGFNPDPIEVLARAVVRDYVIDITME